MRQVQIISDRAVERMLADDDIIVSKTDLSGNITYVNDAFIRISGFSKEELIGSPQNIVRHPDMPREAFRDFWETIKAGKPWSGMVKNRCKNGDYYWVLAHVSPIFKGDTVVGYTSVRVQPTRQQIQGAVQAYALLAAQPGRYSIVEGRLQRKIGTRRLKNWLGNKPFKAKMFTWIVVMTTLALANITVQHVGVSATAQTSEVILAWLLLIAFLPISVLAYKDLIRPLSGLQGDVEELVTGALNTPIQTLGSGDMKRVIYALRSLQVNLRLIVSQIREASSGIDERMTLLSRENVDLSTRTQEQSNYMLQMDQNMQKILDSIKENELYCEDAMRLSNEALAAAGEGAHSVEQVSHGMVEIEKSAQQVMGIISIIDSIAFKTNILALNAAVEAARAGESGRGFAVVATEVRNLSLQSAESAKHIKSLIEEVVDRIERASRQSQDTSIRIQKMLSFAQETSSVMQKIVQSNSNQSLSLNQAEDSVQNLRIGTQRNVEQVSRASATVVAIHDETERLLGLVDTFKV